MELLFYILSGLIAVSPLIAGIILKIRPPKKIVGTVSELKFQRRRRKRGIMRIKYALTYY